MLQLTLKNKQIYFDKMPTYTGTHQLTYQEVYRRLADASEYFLQDSAKYNRPPQKMRLKRISLTAKSLREKLKRSDGDFRLDLEGTIKTARQKIHTEHGSVGTSRMDILAYIRCIERRTEIKYIPTGRATNYPQCPR